MIHVEIDSKSGLCFGVVRAIEKAEEYLNEGKKLSSLGQMVHNAEEVGRLEKMGMKTITCNDLQNDPNENVLIRAHGEPPSTYNRIKNENKNIVDATCPIVLKLQGNVRKIYNTHPEAQVAIYGKPGHAEVIGLVGQTQGNAVVLTEPEEVQQLDAEKPVFMFSQTTMPLEGFAEMKDTLENYIEAEVTTFDTICRKVAHRVPEISEFAANHDVCIFVSGKNSSNGRMLYEVAKKANPDTHFVTRPADLKKNWFKDEINVGVCGATSTPHWLMENVKNAIERMF